jgi:hypothetical protein
MPEPAQPPAAAESKEHSLRDIGDALGKPDPALLDALLEGTTDTQLVDKGRQIASSRVLTDLRRIYAIAHTFWASASKDQRDKLRGFTPELLAVAVDQALSLDAMWKEHEDRGQEQGATRATAEAALSEVFTQALTLRDQAYNVLLGVAGSSKSAQEEVAQAVGTAEDAAALTRGLGQLAALGKRYLAEKKGAIATRAKLLQLDAAYVGRIEETATALSKAAQAAAARPAGQKVTLGALNRADGINIHLLTLIIRAFEGGHEQDPTIPRLVPIATRRLFDRSSRKKTDASEEQAQGNTQQPS